MFMKGILMSFLAIFGKLPGNPFAGQYFAL